MRRCGIEEIFYLYNKKRFDIKICRHRSIFKYRKISSSSICDIVGRSHVRTHLNFCRPSRPLVDGFANFCNPYIRVACIAFRCISFSVLQCRVHSTQSFLESSCQSSYCLLVHHPLDFCNSHSLLN